MQRQNDSTDTSNIFNDNDLLFIVLSLINEREFLLAAQVVCSNWKNIARHNAFWRPLLKKEALMSSQKEDAFTLFRNIYNRKNTFFCVGRPIQVAEQTGAYASKSLSSNEILAALKPDTEHQIRVFNTLKDAIYYADLNIHDAEVPANMIYNYPPIFVIQCGTLTRLTPDTITSSFSPHIKIPCYRMDVSNVEKIHHVLYKTGVLANGETSTLEKFVLNRSEQQAHLQQLHKQGAIRYSLWLN